MMQFIRKLSIKHRPAGDHYVLSIPGPVAGTLGLHEGGGLVSIELFTNFTHKKGKVVLKAYWDSDIAWREQFDPTSVNSKMFKPMAIPPKTMGPSKPFGCGHVYDRSVIHEIRAASKWLEAEFKRAFPSRRGRKLKRQWCIK